MESSYCAPSAPQATSPLRRPPSRQPSRDFSAIVQEALPPSPRKDPMAPPSFLREVFNAPSLPASDAGSTVISLRPYRNSVVSAPANEAPVIEEPEPKSWSKQRKWTVGTLLVLCTGLVIVTGLFFGKQLGNKDYSALTKEVSGCLNMAVWQILTAVAVMAFILASMIWLKWNNHTLEKHVKALRDQVTQSQMRPRPVDDPQRIIR